MGEVDLPKDVFDVPMNNDLLAQAIRVLRARARRPWAHTKNRGDVRGGGKKPWAQKGTGRARHGSSRSPIWRGGGVTFGPRRERGYQLDLPETMRKKALAVALSAKVRDNEVAVLDELALEVPKTRAMAQSLQKISREAFGSQRTKKMQTLVVALSEKDQDVARATKNIPYARSVLAKDLTVLDLLSARYLVFPKSAISIFEQRVQRRKKSKKNA